MPRGCADCSTVHYDFFSALINPNDFYWNLVDGGAGSQVDPLGVNNGIGATPLGGSMWGFGGSENIGTSPQTLAGSISLDFELPSSSSAYLTLTLDTATSPDADMDYASWGSMNAIEVLAITSGGARERVTPTWVVSPFDPDAGTSFLVDASGVTSLELAGNNRNSADGLNTQAVGIWGIGAQLPTRLATTGEQIVGYELNADVELSTWDVYAGSAAGVPEPMAGLMLVAGITLVALGRRLFPCSRSSTG